MVCIHTYIHTYVYIIYTHVCDEEANHNVNYSLSRAHVLLVCLMNIMSQVLKISKEGQDSPKSDYIYIWTFSQTHLALGSNEEVGRDCDVRDIDTGNHVDGCGEGVVYGDDVGGALTDWGGQVDDCHYARRGGLELNMVELVLS